MNHLKCYEEFHTELFPKRSFGQTTQPEEPFKRYLTKEEERFLMKYFPYYSFIGVDKNGYIILGGGEYNGGRYYITDEDLEKYMSEVNDPNSELNSRPTGGMG